MSHLRELSSELGDATIFERVQALKFPLGQYAVVGGAMEALGIRPARDVDIIATDELIDDLLDQGWTLWPFKPEDQGVDGTKRRLAKGDIHVKSEYSCHGQLITKTADLIEGAIIIQGIPFAAIGEILKWKIASGRKKDARDVELINDYLKKATDLNC